MKKVVFKPKPKSMKKLKDFMRKEQAAVDPNKCEDLVSIWTDKINAIIKANNRNTRY